MAMISETSEKEPTSKGQLLETTTGNATVSNLHKVDHGELIPYDQIPSPCCTLDGSAFIKEVNDAMCSLFKYRKEQLTHKSFFEVLHTSSYETAEKILLNYTSSLAANDGVVGDSNGSNNKSSAKATSSQMLADIPVWLRKSDGVVFPGNLYVLAVQDNVHDDGNNDNTCSYKVQNSKSPRSNYHINIVIIDNTLNQSKLEQVQKDKEELKRKESIKDEFLAVASHELRTPIQPILGFALLAKRGVISQETAWENILGEARRLQQLTTDILDVTRIESGSLTYEIKKELINPLLRSIADSVRHDLREGVTLDLIFSKEDENLEIEIDRPRITQVVHNLLGNAIKFTEKGYIKIESKASRQLNRLEICISDSGKGLSEDIMPKLFEKFATKGHGSVENNKGTGLGLYISRAILKAHNGDIHAFNNDDGGASFLITLPINMKKAPSRLP